MMKAQMMSQFMGNHVVRLWRIWTLAVRRCPRNPIQRIKKHPVRAKLPRAYRPALRRHDDPVEIGDVDGLGRLGIREIDIQLTANVRSVGLTWKMGKNPVELSEAR